MRVSFDRGALADLEEIFTYIAADNPSAADAFVRRVRHVARLIGGHPLLGRQTKRAMFRVFPIGAYLLVYELRDQDIIIRYVRHGARRRPWEGE